MHLRRSALFAALASAFALSCTTERVLGPTQFVGGQSSILTPSVVISQVYGGGGNAGATYKNDFIELFNPGATAVSVAGWSVQYASAAGTTWQVTNLSGAIQPGGYYLVQEAAGAAGTTNLPTPDATGNIPMALGAGKVWLVSATAVLSGACPTGTSVVDQVSFGTTASSCGAFGTTATLTNLIAAIRNDGGCAYTGVLSTDFATGAPTPRNSASATHTCGGGGPPPVASVTVAPSSTSVNVGHTAQFTATAKDAGGNPTSTTFTWTSSSTAIATVDATGLATGVVAGGPVTITATSANGIAGTAAFTVTTPPPPPPIVITELMGNPGKVDDNTPGGEWFEVFNTSHAPVNMHGWTIASGIAAGGTETHVIAADVIVPAGGFAVLGNNADQTTNGGLAEQYQYAGIFLGNNTTDWISLRQTDGTLADSVSYSTRDATGAVTSPTYSPAAGIARAVIDIAADNSTMAGSNWADAPAAAIYGLGDRGTPGTGPYFATGTGAPVLVTITPASSQVTVGSGRLLAATAKDADGLNTPSTFTWTTSDATIATVSSTGVVTGVALGTGVVITATSSNGIVGTATVDVVPPAVANIAVSLNSTPIPVSFITPAFATAKDASGNTISPAPKLTWGSTDPSVATVDTLGYITAVAPGTALITATAPNGIAGSSPTFTVVDSSAATGAVYRNHVEFGVPHDADPSDDVIITRPQYELSYNPNRGGPNWVAWDLNATDFGSSPRCNCFSPDPLLPVSVYHVVDFDYRNGGYDRGHMTMSEMRTSTLQENARTFYLSNVLPQWAENNQGPWEQFEIFTNNLAQNSGKEIYIYAGGIYSSTPGTLKNEGKVQIPDYTWKIAVILNAGQGIADVHSLADIQVIAVKMPNLGIAGSPASAIGIRNTPWQNFLTTVDDIEARTGYDFLAPLPDQIEIPLEANDQPPIPAVGGPYAGSEGSVVAFDGSGSSDPEHDAITYAWDFGDGATATGATPGHAYADNGTYTVTLTVTDVHGAFTSATTTATISNVAPTATIAAPAAVDEGSAFTLSLTGAFDPSSVDQASLRFAFDCGDGAGFGPLGSSASVSCATTDNGLLAVRARVQDKDGGFNEYTGTVAVTNVAPTATFAATALVNEGSPFTLSLTGASDASSVDATTLRYAFDCGSGFGPLGTATVASCPTSDNGTFTARGRVQDKDGGFSEYSAVVQVANVAPVITAFTAPGSPQRAGRGLSVTVSFTDPGTADTHVTSIAWGDGTTSSAPGEGTVSLTHTYVSAGLYSLTATVTDDDGGASSAHLSADIIVTDQDAGFVTGGAFFMDDAGRSRVEVESSYERFVLEGHVSFHGAGHGPDFEAERLDWMVVTGELAFVHGTGRISSRPGTYTVLLVVSDPARHGRDGVRVSLRDAAGNVVYDNQAGQPDDSDAVTPLSGGNLTIHRPRGEDRGRTDDRR